MNEIRLEQKIIIISTDTIINLFEHENGSDLVALYMFYHKQCKIQKTNQSFTTSEFAKKGLGWGDKRFKDAKKQLKDLMLIEDVQLKNEKGVIEGWFVKLNFIESLNKANLSSGAETHPVDTSRPGCQKTNAGSNININAGNIKEKEEQTIPHKEKEEVSNTSNENSSSLYGNTDDTLTSNKDTDNKKTSSKRKDSAKKTFSYPTYEEIVAAYGATELNKVIYSMIEDLYIQQNLTIKDIGKIREEIIKLSLDKFLNVFYRDHEGAYHGSSVVISDMIKFIGYFQNNPDKEIKSLIGRIRTWLTHKF